MIWHISISLTVALGTMVGLWKYLAYRRWQTFVLGLPRATGKVINQWEHDKPSDYLSFNTPDTLTVSLPGGIAIGDELRVRLKGGRSGRIGRMVVIVVKPTPVEGVLLAGVVPLDILCEGAGHGQVQAR